MIPLSYFLIAWIIGLGIFAFLLLLTLIQTLRHGLPVPSTYVSTFLFLAVIAFVILGVGVHLTTVDWSGSIAILPNGPGKTAETIFGL
jgi:hypothetical protein